MGAYVARERALFAEFLVAKLAVEGPLVRVDALVHLELVLLVARVAAYAAHEALGPAHAAVVDADVRVQVGLQQERPAAQFAQVRLDSAVSLPVDRQPRGQHHFAALFALHLSYSTWKLMRIKKKVCKCHGRPKSIENLGFEWDFTCGFFGRRQLVTAVQLSFPVHLPLLDQQLAANLLVPLQAFGEDFQPHLQPLLAAYLLLDVMFGQSQVPAVVFVFGQRYVRERFIGYGC